MTLFPTSSSTKMDTDSSPDSSSREDEHDWDSYLIETNSEAAPSSNFKQPLIPPVNEFTVGDKLESIDPRNQDSWCIGTIIDTDGPRLRIRLDGTDDRNDFWRLVDSADIRCFGKTEKLGGQIVPPLGFQQNSTRWKKYFERNVKDGPFAPESCFKPQPLKPEKNLFKRGQKLEAIDPRHPQVICPATVSNVNDYQMTLSLDGWSSSNNFKVPYYSRDIFPVGWCQLAKIRLAKVGGNPNARTSNKTTPNKQNGNNRQQQSKSKKTIISPVSNHSSYSPTTMDEKNNNLTDKTKSIKTEFTTSNNFDEDKTSPKKKRSTVTVYLNYTGDNTGMLLNPQKFRSSMPSVFGPDEFFTVFKSIINSCIKCAFQPQVVTKEILDIYPMPDEDEKDPYIQMKLDNGTIMYIAEIVTLDDFWDAVSVFQSAVLSANDLFVSTPRISFNNSSSSFLDSSVSPDKKDSSPSYQPTINSTTKRKSTELTSQPEKKVLTYNNTTSSLNTSVHDTKSLLNTNSISTIQSPPKPIQNGGSHRPERYTPNEVASFIRNIDPSFDNLATRFLQEEIDGKALLLLTTDTLMRHMGLKLGPSLKIVHHIDQLKKR